jgi:hypothetical protein
VTSGAPRPYIGTVERKKRMTLPDGRTVDATELSFRSSGENWNEYLVDDGTVIRLKLVVTEIVRIDGEYDADGNPAYIVKSASVPAISAPDELRRQP